EDRPELGFKTVFHSFTATSQRAKNCARAARQDLFVRNQDEVLEAERVRLIVQEIRLGGKRDALEIVERVDGVGSDSMLAKKIGVETREWEDDGAQIASELLR